MVLAKNANLIDKDYEMLSETIYINYINDFIQHYSGGFKHENSKHFTLKELEYGKPNFLNSSFIAFNHLENDIKNKFILNL